MKWKLCGTVQEWNGLQHRLGQSKWETCLATKFRVMQKRVKYAFMQTQGNISEVLFREHFRSSNTSDSLVYNFQILKTESWEWTKSSWHEEVGAKHGIERKEGGWRWGNRFVHGYIKTVLLAVFTAPVFHSLKCNFYINELSQNQDFWKQIYNFWNK